MRRNHSTAELGLWSVGCVIFIYIDWRGRGDCIKKKTPPTSDCADDLVPHRVAKIGIGVFPCPVWCVAMNPNKRPPPSSSAGAFEGGDGTKRSREAILRPGKDAPGNVLLVRVTDIVHPVSSWCCKTEYYEVRSTLYIKQQ